MSFHEAGPDEAAGIAAFLRTDPDWTMFPLSNLTHYGMGREGRYQMRFWLKGQRLEAALGLSAMGMLLPYLPGLGADDLAPLRPLLEGEAISGLIGPSEQAEALRAALGLRDSDAEHMDDEPGFALDLADLVLPDDPTIRLRSPDLRDMPLLVQWRAAYRGEVTATPPERREAAAREDIETYIARDSHRILEHDGTPVAMTGFNAELPEAVQIGGVYTPPALRGRGHARAAVALHLADARRAGVRRAVLFAANDAAARAYRAIGFQPNGRMTMILYRPGTRVA
ncbi:MAG TPA: GNAT family N-acetyltransferase [Albidovulum sp.]|uniref:GNAT family N-acetyltransferase n=1 Tax=Albidovulum sp. TaxID=1872424 RepID=UPI002C7C4CE6|nr:GNAT family N-acetyltransferase [Albidovulum sp.]